MDIRVNNMGNSILNSSLELLPVAFIGMWFFVTTTLGLFSRWYALMREFPDRDEAESIRLKGQSGTMSGVSMRGILNISVCPSGLRIGILRIFGPFCRNFFVPWDQIHVERKTRLWGNTAKLQFGSPLVGWLRLSSNTADYLARSSLGKWPEAGSFPLDKKSNVLKTALIQWAIGTSAASLFFILVPRIVAPNAADYPPIAVAILFPAIVLGIASVVRYFGRIKNGL
jgi:hypothetical protein